MARKNLLIGLTPGMATRQLDLASTSIASPAADCPRNPRKRIRAGRDLSLSSQEPVHILQFGGDVDLLHAGRQAVAAADAGRAVLRQGGVFLPRPVELVIIPGIPLVPEDVRNPDMFGATGDALGTQQAGQSLV